MKLFETPEQFSAYLTETIGGEWDVWYPTLEVARLLRARCGLVRVAETVNGWAAYCYGKPYALRIEHALRVDRPDPAEALRALGAEMLQSMGPLAAPPRPDWRDTEPTAAEREAHKKRGGWWLVKRATGGVAVVYFEAYIWFCASTTMPIRDLRGAKWCPCEQDFQAVLWPEVAE